MLFHFGLQVSLPHTRPLLTRTPATLTRPEPKAKKFKEPMKNALPDIPLKWKICETNRVFTLRLKQAIKLLHALVLAINKATCRQDKRISQIKD